jgi:hypothetical protein
MRVPARVFLVLAGIVSASSISLSALTVAQAPPVHAPEPITAAPTPNTQAPFRDRSDAGAAAPRRIGNFAIDEEDV